MTIPQTTRIASEPTASPGRAREWLEGLRPQLGERRFWTVQGIVVVIAAIHTSVELAGLHHDMGSLRMILLSMFMIPVIYAALHFGSAGAIATAAWIVVITVPNWIWMHEGTERLAMMFHHVVLVALAAVVGQRVDAEMGARRRAEAASAALVDSETRYRSLFESSPVSILVVSEDGVVLDANPAAGVLFGRTAEGLMGAPVVDLIGAENVLRLDSPPQEGRRRRASVVIGRDDGSEVYLEPTQTQVSDSRGHTARQILLRDITQELNRQKGLKVYAAHIVRAQEEERRRIARDLHDDSIQTLILLCRRLNSVESASEALPPPVMEEVQAAKEIAEQVVRGLRDYTKALRPPILDDLGVVTSLRRLVYDFTERTGIAGQLKLEGEERRLPQDTEVNIYRIAQEALSNIERHSKATEISLTFSIGEKESRLDVRDNGVGFTVPPMVEKLSLGGQLGLVGMHERAESLGGYLQVQSSLDTGTTVTLSCPV